MPAAPARRPRRPTAALNVAAYAGAMLGGKVLTLVWTAAAARALSQREFGSFSLALTVGLLVSATVEWGFDPVLVRAASRDPESTDRLLSAALTWQTLLGVPAMLVAAAAVWPTRATGEDRLALALVLAALLFDQASDSCRAASAARGDQRSTSAALLAQRLATAGLVLAAVLAGLGLVGLAATFLAGSAIGAAAHLAALRRVGVRPGRHLVDRDAMRAVASGSAALGLSSLVLVVLARADVLILEGYAGDRAVATYSVPYRLFETTLFVVFAVNSVLFARISAESQDHAAVKERMGSALSFVLLAYLPFAAACLLEPHAIIALLFGDQYASDSAAALRWLSAAPVLFALSFVVGSTLTVYGQGRAVFVSAVAATVVNLGLNVALVPHFGGTAAAAVTTLSYGVDAGVSALWLRRVIGPLGLPVTFVEATGAALVMAALLRVVPGPALVRLAIGTVGAAGSWMLLVRWRRPQLLGLLRGLRPGTP